MIPQSMFYQKPVALIIIGTRAHQAISSGSVMSWRKLVTIHGKGAKRTYIIPIGRKPMRLVDR